RISLYCFFFVPSTTAIYTLSLHDALPISVRLRVLRGRNLRSEHVDPDVGLEGVGVLADPDDERLELYDGAEELVVELWIGDEFLEGAVALTHAPHHSGEGEDGAVGVLGHGGERVVERVVAQEPGERAFAGDDHGAERIHAQDGAVEVVVKRRVAQHATEGAVGAV